MGWDLVIYVGILLLTYLLAPKPPEPKPASLSDFNVPTADASRPVPVVFGTVLITGPNVVWYGDLKVKKIKESSGWGPFSSSQTVGYKYYLGIHFVLCHGPADSLTEIVVGDRTAWTGSASDTTINIDKEGLFGGEEKEGGIKGAIDVLMGLNTQAANSYLSNKLGTPIPAFRGVVSCVLNRVYIGTSPYLKNWAFKFKRTDTLTDNTAQWYSAKANINSGDMNPAHLLRECLTNNQWGMGYPTSQINDTAWTAAADTLYTENFGLSMQWVQSETIEKFIQVVADHIAARIYVSAETGLFTIKLIRDDYDAGTLPVFSPDNVVDIENFERRGWGETVNQVTVVYRDRESNQDKSLTLQDLGNIEMQGGVVAQTRQYPGIPNGDLAGRVCLRDLKLASAPLSSLKIKVNRSAWDKVPGDVFKFTWPEFGISEVVYRVGVVDTGELTKGYVTIDATEDVFGLSSNVYTTPQTSGWSAPINDPTAITIQRAVEAPYWDVQKNFTQSDIAAFQTDFGIAVANAAPPTGDSSDYTLLSKTGANAYVQRSTGPFSATALLNEALTYDSGSYANVVIDINNAIDVDLVLPNTHAYIGDEMVEFISYDSANSQITVHRGILDTIPMDHSIGTRIWFTEGIQTADYTDWADATTVDLKLLPTTSLGTLDEGSATATSVTMNTRYQRPYLPANYRINGTYFPATIGTGLDVPMTWRHRDRLDLSTYRTWSNNTSYGPEAGTTYTLRVYNHLNSLGRTVTGITANNYTYTQAFEIADFGSEQSGLRFELEAVNGSYTSLYMYDHSITRV